MYKLIIVDDEEKIAEGIASLFPWEQIGYEVKAWFGSGEEVLTYVEKNPVDVILSDIQMPDIDGIELCRRLRDKGNYKVIFFSSHQNYTYFRSAIQYQVFDYLLKPIRYNELLACMEKVTAALEKESQQEGKEKVQEQTYYGSIIAAVQDYVEVHFKDASLEAAAERVNLSASYLSRIFKEKSGSGFSEYLLTVRMTKACEMLKDIRYKSYDIAYHVGYDNPKNFSRAFKTFYNISPSDYRKQIEKKGKN
ncbi:response regulator [Lachnospiraceae bacterium OttesenSCG-928-D06]|nr:response regulator [Lachnospiraceae bacterium OttesenSCG-928-D06]